MQTPPGSAMASRRAAIFDAITEDVVVIKNDVTDVDADTEFDPLILRHGGVLLGHAALNFNGHRVPHPPRWQTSTSMPSPRGLDDPSAMGGDCGVDEGLSDRLEPGQRAFLIDTHQAAIAGDIRRQNSCQSAAVPFSPVKEKGTL